MRTQLRLEGGKWLILFRMRCRCCSDSKEQRIWAIASYTDIDYRYRITYGNYAGFEFICAHQMTEFACMSLHEPQTDDSETRTGFNSDKEPIRWGVGGSGKSMIIKDIQQLFFLHATYVCI